MGTERRGDNLTKSFNPSQIVDFGVFANYKIKKNNNRYFRMFSKCFLTKHKLDSVFKAHVTHLFDMEKILCSHFLTSLPLNVQCKVVNICQGLCFSYLIFTF